VVWVVPLLEFPSLLDESSAQTPNVAATAKAKSVDGGPKLNT
jgi:hypothetical protein